MNIPDPIPNNTAPHSTDESTGLRNAWQWLAMITMIIDHIGYFYQISPLRYVGRLGMPLYAMLFVITVRRQQINFKRILLLGLLSQYQYLYIFGELQLNIIFGFAIFAWAAEGIRRRCLPVTVTGFLMMWIPVSYGWYLYATLATFCWIERKSLQRGVFAVLTGIYSLYSCLIGYSLWWRQLLAMFAPFIEGIKAPRPNKYLYRYFYPGHLLILAVIQYAMIGTPWPRFIHYEPQTDYYDTYEDDEFHEDMFLYDYGGDDEWEIQNN